MPLGGFPCQRRRWAIAPLDRPPESVTTEVRVRPTSEADDEQLAAFLDTAYVGTIDFDPETDHRTVLHTWRTIDGADDAASRVVVHEGRIVGACLIGAELGQPFLYDVAVVDGCRRSGLAGAMLASSLDHLADSGHEACAAWVTDGNLASERLLGNAGFVPVTPPVGERAGIGYHRAGTALDRLDVNASIPAGATSDDDGSVLWLVGQRQDTPADVEIAGTTVAIRWVDPDDPTTAALIASMTPLRRIAWFLARRRECPRQ